MKTLAADKRYAAGAFLHELESDEGVVPLVAMPAAPIKAEGAEADARRRAKRRQRTKRYALAQRIRKRVEEINGWTKRRSQACAEVVTLAAGRCIRGSLWCTGRTTYRD